MPAVLLSPMPAAATLVELRSLCRPPPSSPSRHAALAVTATATLAVKLWPGSSPTPLRSSRSATGPAKMSMLTIPAQC
ncbi:hypothetical protein PF003_g6653 [Phytophthora fragariae]|nr:hypothetical protein PF003_g6653 [Phytophthora fragariae]